MSGAIIADFMTALREHWLEPPPLVPVRPHLRRVPPRFQLPYAQGAALMLLALGRSNTDPAACARRAAALGGASLMKAPPNLATARAQFVLALLRQNGSSRLFGITDEQDYRHARGLTLERREAAVDALVARGWARLQDGVWLELAESAR